MEAVGDLIQEEEEEEEEEEKKEGNGNGNGIGTYTDQSENEIESLASDVISVETESDAAAPLFVNIKLVRVGSWNINGLGDYKQKDLLLLASGEGIDILALCETHLETPEEIVHWDRIVTKDTKYFWSGRQARPPRGRGKGRNSGGVGLLIRSDWQVHCVTLPQCEHDCLHFIRINLPDSPTPVFIAAIYYSPIGAVRWSENSDLLDELETLVGRYRSLGVVIVMGDFNMHIACHPSTIMPIESADSLRNSSRVEGNDSNGLLTRSSVDKIGLTDMDEPSPTAVAFVDRMDIAGLIILNGLVDVGDGLTAESTCGQSSVIDFIMVDSDHWQQMESVQRVQGATAEVNSDHQLITSSLSYDPIVGRGDSATVEPDTVSHLINDTRYQINTKGDRHHFDNYQLACKQKLTELLSRWSALSEDTPLDIENAWAEYLVAIRLAAHDSLGARPPADSTRLAYRPQDVKQVRRWKDQRREMERALEIRPSNKLEAERLTLNRRIRNHIKKALREQQNQEMEKIQKLRRHQMREHWQAIKSVGGIKSKPLMTPVSAVDKDGIEHTDTAGVRMTWLECWAKLAQHHPDNPQFDVDHHDRVEESLRDSPQIDTGPKTPSQVTTNLLLNGPLKIGEVEASISKLGNNKSAGADGVVSELLKNGGEMMIAVLHKLCQIAWESAEVPLDWLRGVVVPLHKDGDRREPLNYRPITLLSIAGKVYTGVLQSRLMFWSENNGIIEPEQGGFRPGRGCPEQLFTLTELTKIRRLSGYSTYACFIDIKKAYDTVWHAGLKQKLLGYGISGRMYSAICSLYEGCESTIRLGGLLGYTGFFPIKTGVRQGCILSPWLYSLFINDLARELKRIGIGATINRLTHSQICLLLYADDIVLLADSEKDMQRLMKCVHEYSRKWRFEVNHSKCGLIRFNVTGSTQPTTRLTIGKSAVPWVESYKYLGVELHNGIPFRQFRKRKLASATRAGHQVAGMGMYSGKLSVPLGIQVYQALVRPLLEYAAEVTSIQAWPAADIHQTAMGKRILQCSTRTSSAAVRGELGWHSMEARFQQLRVSFWGKIQMLQFDLPTKIIYEASLEEFSSQICKGGGEQEQPAVDAELGWDIMRPESSELGLTLWPALIRFDLFSLGLKSYWDNPSSVIALGKEGWKSLVRARVNTRETVRWWREVQQQSILRSYRLLKQPDQLQLESYLAVPHGGWSDQRRAGRRALTRIRTGVNDFRINTGRWENESVEERICQLCAAEIETEQHFLIECKVYATERENLWNQLNQLVNSSKVPLGPGETRFDMETESASTQLTLMTGGSHDRITTKSLYRRVMSTVLIAIAQWVEKRKEKLTQLKLELEEEEEKEKKEEEEEEEEEEETSTEEE